MTLILFTGKGGAGKSAAAAELVSNHGFVLVKFATPLKNMLRAFGLTDAEIEGESKEAPCEKLGGQTPRHAMQTLGTEWGRDLITPDLWVTAWARDVSKHDRVVVDDLRFPNELKTALALGGRVFEIVRKGGTINDGHVSEAGVGFRHGTIHNNQSIEELRAAVCRLLD